MNVPLFVNVAPDNVRVPEVGEYVPDTSIVCETVKLVLAVVVPVPIVKS